MNSTHSPQETSVKYTHYHTNDCAKTRNVSTFRMLRDFLEQELAVRWMQYLQTPEGKATLSLLLRNTGQEHHIDRLEEIIKGDEMKEFMGSHFEQLLGKFSVIDYMEGSYTQDPNATRSRVSEVLEDKEINIFAIPPWMFQLIGVTQADFYNLIKDYLRKNQFVSLGNSGRLMLDENDNYTVKAGRRLHGRGINGRETFFQNIWGEQKPTSRPEGTDAQSYRGKLFPIMRTRASIVKLF